MVNLELSLEDINSLTQLLHNNIQYMEHIRDNYRAEIEKGGRISSEDMRSKNSIVFNYQKEIDLQRELLVKLENADEEDVQ